MAEIAVIYKSKYGHARDYAKWIADALGADLFEGAKPDKLARYNTLVFGGGLYAGGIGGARLLRDNFERLKDRNLIVFTVGLSGTSDPTLFQPSIDLAFTPEMQRHIRFFHLRGGIDYKRLNFAHRSIMGMMRIALKGKKNRTQEDEIMLEAYGGRVDFRDKASALPIIAYVQGLQKEEKTP